MRREMAISAEIIEHERQNLDDERQNLDEPRQKNVVFCLSRVYTASNIGQ